MIDVQGGDDNEICFLVVKKDNIRLSLVNQKVVSIGSCYPFGTNFNNVQ